MALLLKDRVKETTTTAGLGTLTLAGSADTFEPFSSLGNGNTTYYAIVAEGNDNWEVGIGTVGTSTLSRDIVLASSNLNAKVNFPAGVKDVFVTLPANKIVSKDDATGINSGISLAEYVDFDTAAAPATAVGRLFWNDQDGTLDLGLKGGSVTIHIGQKQVIRIVNKVGSSLSAANYQCVKISGAQGQRPKVALAQANNDANSADTIGLVNETIADNQEGFVCTGGTITNINTTGSLQGESWNDGDVLYLSGTVAGRITNVKPSAPTHTVIVGFVIYAHINQGKIYVKIDNGYELDELHNVNITSPSNGQVLTYNNGLWENQTNGSGTVTSVSGTGGYGGLTLTGTVTSSGNLTLGGTPTGTWPVSVSGNAATVTNGVYTTGDQTIGGTKTFSSTISGSVSGNAGTATTLQTTRSINLSNFNGSANITVPRVFALDDRTLAPSDGSANYVTAYFTSWANNNTSPYADSLLFRTWGDGTAGNDNLLMLRRDTLGMRVWQQTFGSATAFATFKDVAWTDGTNATGTWTISTSGNAGTVTNGVYTTGDQTIAGVKTFSGTSTIVNGNVGIGTSSPAEKLSVNQGNFYALRSGGAKLRLLDENNEVSLESSPVGADSEMVFKTNAIERMRLTSTGLGIGTTSPINKLTISGSSLASGELGTFAITGNTTAKRLAMGVDSTSTMYSWVQSVENGIGYRSLVLQQLGGNLGVGTASPGYKLDVSSTATSVARFTGPANGFTDFTDGTGTLRVQMLSNVPHIGSFTNHNLNIITNNTVRATFDTSGNLSVTGNATIGSGSTVGGIVIGYRDVPVTIQNATYSFALADAGKAFGKDNATAYTYTIPANASVAFPVGTVITVFNNNATSNITVAITTDTLRLAGTTTTGSRTVAPFSLCTLFKVSSTVWMASGAGVT